MTTVQKQELSVFDDHSTLSKALFEQGEHHVLFVTSKLGTSPPWLINALVETQVFGAPLTLNESSSSAANRAHSRLPIANSDKKAAIIASWLHSSDYFHSALGKLKIDQNRYQVHDYLTDFVLKNHDKPASKVLKSLIQELTMQSATDLLILEQPELLMHLLNITSDVLHLDFINPLTRIIPVVVIVSYTESYDNPGADSTERLSPDMIEQIRFLNGCFFKSIVVFGIKPLMTGRAKDITGTLTISRGGASLSHLPINVAENEYLFHTQKDATKLFYR
ncbi:LANO_0C09142g1_1 [Lachancea nothofagi CBS 11611]|uniref:LANO_0C09142g1_1 n=1 Tax=Lachancea nothofagi CBS 11611 TaxID=1266666 RepID=A0A1G4J9T2_9SACH|nr:LANO_0C09142g1_1 [Lachancea nothofagi CBS 11611]